MHLEFSSSESVTKAGYYAKIHVSEGYFCDLGLQFKKNLNSLKVKALDNEKQNARWQKTTDMEKVRQLKLQSLPYACKIFIGN